MADLDERGFKSHESRGYGYAPRGEACLGQYDWQLKNQTNAIGAVMNNPLFAVGLYDGSINSDVFYSWVEQI
ncbi:transposase [Suttonella ornithocola]|uniref:transposase n=1 Tax=Suttonella ornithocola TaxID=279832 RepID=UPI000E1BC034